MATLRDWKRLAQSTIEGIESRQMADLYSQEWPETRRRLVAEHQELIDGERKKIKRWLRESSAILYGLTKRLAPQRRILFIIAGLVTEFSIFTVWGESRHGHLFWTYVGLTAAFVIFIGLLGMELMDKIKYRDELELARDLQSALIPKEIEQPEGYSVAAFNHIANTVGGDIYDFKPLSDGRYAVLFGDASGHGMAAGLIMAVAHATFRTQLEVDPEPAPMVVTLNRILCATGTSRSFFAGIYLLLESDGRFRMWVAGHPPVLRLSPEGRIAERFGSGSYPLGIKRDYTWEVVEGQLAPGETLLFHSDGLPESRDVRGEEFGDERIEAICDWAAGRPATELVGALVGHWRLFTQRVPAEDDVSIAAIRRT